MVVRKAVAEFIGTFALVFLGCGVIITQGVLDGIKISPFIEGAKKGFIMQISPPSYLVVAIAFGLTLLTAVYIFGHISSAHLNPAITIGFAVAGRFPWLYVPVYLLAQFLGALLASLIHWVLLPEGVNVNFGATLLMPDLRPVNGFLIEVILTSFLMLAYMAVMTDKKFPAAASGLTIGLTFTVCTLMGWVFTGGSMNPARSLAPAIFSATVVGEAIRQLWIYLIAPPIGACVGAVIYEFLRPSEFAVKGAPEDLMVAAEKKQEPTEGV